MKSLTLQCSESVPSHSACKSLTSKYIQQDLARGYLSLPEFLLRNRKIWLYERNWWKLYPKPHFCYQNPTSRSHQPDLSESKICVDLLWFVPRCSSFCTHSPAPNLHITPSISGTLHEEPRFVARGEYMQPKMPRQRLLHLKPTCQQTLRNTEPVNKPFVNQVNEPSFLSDPNTLDLALRFNERHAARCVTCRDPSDLTPDAQSWRPQEMASFHCVIVIWVIYYMTKECWMQSFVHAALQLFTLRSFRIQLVTEREDSRIKTDQNISKRTDRNDPSNFQELGTLRPSRHWLLSGTLPQSQPRVQKQLRFQTSLFFLSTFCFALNQTSGNGLVKDDSCHFMGPTRTLSTLSDS